MQESAKLDATNKIISVEAINEILEAAEAADKVMREASDREKAQNEPLVYSKQSFKAENYRMSCNSTVYLNNNNTIEYKTARELATFLKTRAFEARSIYIFMHFSYYERGPEIKSVDHHEDISFVIREDTFGVKYTTHNARAVNEIIMKIQQIVANAPVKMDDAMTNQPMTTMKVGLGAGLIPGLLLACVGFVVPQFRRFYGEVPGLFFVVALLLGATVGILIAAKMLEPLYRSIVGKQKYEGYNKKTGQSVYGNDIENYSSTAEVLIGSRVGSMQTRKKLDGYSKRFGKLILPEMVVVLIVSIIVYVVLHFFVG